MQKNTRLFDPLKAFILIIEVVIVCKRVMVAFGHKYS